MRCLPLLACVLLAGCGTARFADLRSEPVLESGSTTKLTVEQLLAGLEERA